MAKKQRIANKPQQITSRSGYHKRYLTSEWESFLNGWFVSDSSIDSVIAKYHTKTVRRSREQHRKNDYVKRYFQLLQTNVIGPDGIVLHALIADKKGKRKIKKNESIERAWRKWMRKSYCDIQGKLDFVQMQQVILTTVAQDGEAIIRLIRDKENPFGIALQLINTERLDVDYNKRLSDKSQIKNSIEFNQYGKPIAYYFLNQEESTGPNGKKYQRVKADEIIHLYRTDFAGQNRGMPWVATALFRMRMLDDYHDAAIGNANVTAKKIFVFKKKFNDDNVDASDIPPVQEESIGHMIVPDNYEFTPFDSQYPNGEIEPFTKAILRGIASGLGISYHSLASDLTSVNYSSLRQGAIDERDTYRTIQNWFINAFLIPLYEKWLESALLFEAVQNLTLSEYEQALCVRFQARRWQWVDPAKEMTAYEKKLNLGVTTRDDIIRELGRDPEHVFNQLQHENEQLTEYGLTSLLSPSPTTNPAKDVINDDETKRDT